VCSVSDHRFSYYGTQRHMQFFFQSIICSSTHSLPSSLCKLEFVQCKGLCPHSHNACPLTYFHFAGWHIHSQVKCPSHHYPLGVCSREMVFTAFHIHRSVSTSGSSQRAFGLFGTWKARACLYSIYSLVWKAGRGRSVSHNWALCRFKRYLEVIALLSEIGQHSAVCA